MPGRVGLGLSGCSWDVTRGGGEDVVDCGWVLLTIIQYDTCRTACTTLVKGTSELEGWMDGWTH